MRPFFNILLFYKIFIFYIFNCIGFSTHNIKKNNIISGIIECRIFDNKHESDFSGGCSHQKFSSYYPYQLNHFERQQNNDGSGNIIFTIEPYINDSHNDGKEIPGFIEIKDVTKAGDLLEKLAYSTNHCG